MNSNKPATARRRKREGRIHPGSHPNKERKRQRKIERKRKRRRREEGEEEEGRSLLAFH